MKDFVELSGFVFCFVLAALCAVALATKFAMWLGVIIP
jgi:hypothetical protein